MKNILLLLLLIGHLFAENIQNTATVAENNQTISAETKSTQTTNTDDGLSSIVEKTNLIGAAVVTGWGVAFWEYFSTSPIRKSEGWFEEDTKYGGADKLGHFYSTYLFSMGFSNLYESYGMSPDEAHLQGALSSWIFQGVMEVGDSFSQSQGFAIEDMAMNTLGSLLYYIREINPSIKSKIDFRLEYLPNFESENDIFTKYDSMKYVLAIKANGFDLLKDTFLKYTELQVGFYSRGYEDTVTYPNKERITYVGVGINMAKVFKDLGWIDNNEFFNYYQLPSTYIATGHEANSDTRIYP